MANSIVVPTSGAVFAQKIGIALLRAGVTTIPLASLAWDAFAASMDFVNSKATDSFLDELGMRLDRLESKQPLGNEARSAVHQSLQRLIFEESEDYARDLARSVAAIEESEDDARILSQVAQAVGEMSSRLCVYLGSLYRMQLGKQTEAEERLLSEVQPFPAGTFGEGDRYDILHNISYILLGNYPSIAIKADLSKLKDLGLIEMPSMGIVSDAPEPWINPPIRVTPLGEAILTSMRDDPLSVPPYSELASTSES